MQVNIQGLDALRDQLDGLGTEVRAACFRALRESAGTIVNDVQHHVRVDTGNLKRDVKARFHNNKLKAEIGWWQNDDDYAKSQEIGTRRVPANPTLLPALEREKRHLADRIRTEVRRVTPS
ncbi:HK97-gp10 family putative phage morphogenesis protein [Streptomyces sp. NPDC059818]|uniref:HK97-gp10 family putative phage morphogenesis protein n=1 Tax=Streptomyces sp. NPDC059818 TaxID=3346962 RepID=UPI00364AD0B6